AVGLLGTLLVILAPGAPLLKEESGAVGIALRVNLVDPIFFDRTSVEPALPANDGPVHVGEINVTNRADQRLEGAKADRRGHVAQMVDTLDDIGVFNAGA